MTENEMPNTDGAITGNPATPDTNAIAADDVFTHIDSGHEIIVVAVGSMKQEGGSWYDAITYRNIHGTNPDRVFTRAESAFREKFVRGTKE